jgi:adenylate kinase
MSVTLLTGVSGLGREEFLGAVSSHSLAYYDLGQLMGEVARGLDVPFSPSNVLRSPAGTLTALRGAAIERFLRDTRGLPDSISTVVSANAIFMLTDRVIEGLSFSDFRSIAPNMIVTLIDAPQRIHERLKEHSGEYFHLTVDAIVRWQEFEVFFSNQMARERGIPHFVVPVNQPETFLDIVTGNGRPIVYVSYPMTHLSEDRKPLVKSFVERLRKYAIVFDPSSIDSSHDNKPYYTPADYRAIHNHTIVRDLDWFIGINSQSVVAYWPSLVYSSGMNDELKFAYENGRDTYLVAEAVDDVNFSNLSPFTTYKSKLFGTSDDFFHFLELSSEQEKDAFLIIQGEIFSSIRTLKDTGIQVTKHDFGRQCDMALRNSMPDRWIGQNGAVLDQMTGDMYERWSEVLARAITSRG